MNINYAIIALDFGLFRDTAYPVADMTAGAFDG